MRDIPRQQIGLIVALGCCKAVLLKATIQLHCISVKGKEESELGMRNAECGNVEVTELLLVSGACLLVTGL
jgi:hypothetical protein